MACASDFAETSFDTGADDSARSIQEAVSHVEQELQKDLSAFRLSATEATGGDHEDESSIACEVENLHGFEASIRKELLELEGSWRDRGQGRARRVYDVPLLVSTFSTDSSCSLSTQEDFLGEGEGAMFPSSSTLFALLGRTRGLSRMSLALVSDFLSSDCCWQSRQSPIWQQWLRHQLETGFPSVLDADWLLRAPLLGKMASSACVDQAVLSKSDIILQRGEIQEIEEEEHDLHFMQQYLYT
jgi:hypothetical protein